MYSLGFACRVRESIQRYLKNNNQQSGFFDWAFVNFDTVLYFIDRIDIPLLPTDFHDKNEICNNHRVITHKYTFMVLLHDLDKNKTFETGINEVVDKYNRRLKRLKEKIMSTDKIDFVHLFSLCQLDPKLGSSKINIPTKDQINSFFKLIYNINPLCKLNLHLLVPPKDCNYTNERFTIDCNLDELIINDNVFIHYLSQDDTMENKNSCNHWSWYQVYDKINNKIN